MRKLLLVLIGLITLTSCENVSNGTRIGTVNKFSRYGQLESMKSWEGHLNITQTGMTSTTGFDFSIDNDKEPPGLDKTLDSAMNYGWKVELQYHQVKYKNWFDNRGSTDYFVTSCKVIDRNFSNKMFGSQIDTNKITFVINLTLAEATKLGMIDSTKLNLLKK